MTDLDLKNNARIIWLAMFGSKTTWRRSLPVLLAVLGLVLIIISLPPQLAQTIIKENGPVECATVVAYVFLTVALWIRALRVGSRAPLMMSFLTLLVACRELDFNSRFTTRNIEHGFTLAYFFDFKVPGKEKLVVACVLIVLFFVVYIIARNLLLPFVRALESKRTDAVMTLQAAFLLACAQPCDEMGHVFTRMRGSYTSFGFSFTVLAETLELGVSLLFVVAFFLWSSEKCEQAE